MTLEYVGGRTGSWDGFTSGTRTVALTGLTDGSDTQARAGDLVIAGYLVGAFSDISLSITDGSTPYTLVSELYANPTGVDPNLRAGYKFMGGSPDATVTFGPTGDENRGGVAAVHVWRGVDPDTPMDVAATTATGTGTGRPDPAAITPVTEGAAIVVVAGNGSDATTPTLFASSDLANFLTARPDAITKSVIGMGSASWAGGTFDPAQFTAGNTGANHGWVAVTLALRPRETITAAATITLGAISLASEGVLPIAGDAALTLGPIALASSGVLSIHADAAITLDAITLTAQGYDAISISGDADITLGPIALVSQAALPIAGAASIALDAITLAGVIKPIILARPPRERTITFGAPTIYAPPEYDFRPGFDPATAWDADTPRDFLAWDAVVVMVAGLAGGDTIALECSLDEDTWFPAIGVDRDDLAFATVIDADGSYEFPAGALLRWGQTGGASDPVVIAGPTPWFETDAMAPPVSRALAFPAARAPGRFLTLRD